MADNGSKKVLGLGLDVALLERVDAQCERLGGLNRTATIRILLGEALTKREKDQEAESGD